MPLYKSLMFLFLLFVSSSLIFSQVFPVFVPISSAGFMSYVQIVSIRMTWILQPLQFTPLLFI